MQHFLRDLVRATEAPRSAARRAIRILGRLARGRCRSTTASRPRLPPRPSAPAAVRHGTSFPSNCWRRNTITPTEPTSTATGPSPTASFNGASGCTRIRRNIRPRTATMPGIGSRRTTAAKVVGSTARLNGFHSSRRPLPGGQLPPCTGDFPANSSAETSGVDGQKSKLERDPDPR